MGVLVRDGQDNVVRRAEFTYDAFDRLLVRWVDEDGDGAGQARETLTLYDTSGRSDYGQPLDDVLAEFGRDEGGTWSLTSRYLYGPAVDQLLAAWENASGLPLGAAPESWPADAAAAFYLADHLGSVRQVVDGSTGQVINEVVYDSFGNVLSESNAEGAGRFKYTAREWFDSLGLQYNRARWYDPAVGRWLSEDPIADDLQNLYRYVGNGPLNGTDPSGLALFENDYIHHEPADPNAVRYIYYVDAGWIWNNPPVLIGALDPSTNLVTRRGVSIPLGSIEREVEKRGTTSDWDAFFASQPAPSARTVALQQLDPKFRDNFIRQRDATADVAEAGIVSYSTVLVSVGADLSALRNAQRLASRADDVTRAKNGAPNNVPFSTLGRVGHEFDPKTLDKILANLKERGVVIAQGDDIVRFLERQGAGAMYIAENGKPGALLLRPGATRLEVVEELVHHGQHLNGRYVLPTDSAALSLLQVQREVAAQDIILGVARKMGWTAEEVAKINANKAIWLQKLAELSK